MGNVFELKLQTADLKGVNIDPKEISENFSEFKLKTEEQLSELKTNIKNSKTLDEIEDFFDSMPLYVDPARLTLRIGDAYIKADNEAEYKRIKKQIETNLGKANIELQDCIAERTAEIEKVKTETRKSTDKVKTEITVKRERKIKYKQKGGTTVEGAEIELTDIPTFNTLTLLQQHYLSHPEMVVEKETTREEKRLRRLTNRFEDADSDKARRRISRKIAKQSDKIADRRAATARNMANAAADYVNAEEWEHQAWYYNDVINALTKDPRSNRVHYFDEYITIDTYHPLFVNANNLAGTIRLTRASVAIYEYADNGRKYTAQERAWLAQYPEDAAALNKGGLIGGMTNWLVEHTKMRPDQADKLYTAAKIGSAIGLGILGWMTIKRVFNIGGKNKKGDGLKWGLGAAAVLIGVPALTGKGVWELLTKGDTQATWNRIRGVLDMNGIENPFESTDRRVIYPAFGNLMFRDMTPEQLRKFIIVDNNGKTKLKVKEITEYKIKVLGETNDPKVQEEIRNQLALLKTLDANKQLDEVTDCYCRVIKADSADQKVLCDELYKNYLDAQFAACKILQDNKNIKIVNQRKFDDYLVEQTVKYGKKPSEIKLKDMLAAGVLAYKDDASKDADNDDLEDTTLGGTEANEDEEESNWEEFKERGKPKWEAFKKAVKNAKNQTSAFVASVVSGEIFRKGESLDLKARREKLAKLRKQLNDLKKQDNVADKTVVTAAEIGLLEAELNDADQMLNKIEAMQKEKIDADLNKMANLPEAEKQNLTNAKHKVNFDLKFKNEGDTLDLTAEGNKLYVNSCGEKTHIRFENGKYYLDNMTVPFDNAEYVIRVANLTNFIKVNFANRASANVEKPWKYDGGDIQFEKTTAWESLKKGDIVGMVVDTQVVDGEDFFSSTMKEMAGTVFQSRAVEYIDYLNSQKNVRNENLWTKKLETGMVPEDLNSMKALFEKEIHVLKKGTLYRPERPDDYPGEEKIHDAGARLEAVGGYLALHSHNQKINIVQNPDNKGWYQIGYVNGAEKDGKLSGDYLPLNFTASEALKVANLVNFYRQVYAGYGTSEKSFNISTFGGDLEFAEDGVFDAIDLDALPNGVAVDQYAKTFGNAKSMSVFCDWLNKMDIREAK